MTDRDLFIAALERADPAERDAWLDQACAGDAECRRRVDVLLRAHDQASKFLADPAAGQLGAEPDEPTRTAHSAHSADETTPATAIDLNALLTPTDKPGLLGTLDHYEILEVVGSGGMGVVLKAFDPKLHRLVAIKLMAPHLSAHGSARKRFEREAKNVAAVRNEHVVAIHAVEAGAATPYLVMEFVGGVSLQERLERRGPLEVKEILRIGMQAARGLAAAHAIGLVHRDVKPANLLLENGVERVKITDFGLARMADDANLTRSGVITGTPNYMSPEQAAGVPVDPRSDLFSLGSVLYALGSGHPPFRAETPLAVLRRVADEPPRPVREINPDIPDWLDAIVRKLLAKNPADRFQTATEVADHLGQHLAHLQQPDSVPMPAAVSLPFDVPAPPTERVWTQIFEATDTKKWWAQIGLLLLAMVLIGWDIAAVMFARLVDRLPPDIAARGSFDVLVPAPGPLRTPIFIFVGVLGIALIAVDELFVKLRWEIPYKGRTLRFENSLLTAEGLFVDGVRIARGLFVFGIRVGLRREIRGTVPDGPGAGDEIRAKVTRGIGHLRCELYARPGPAKPLPVRESPSGPSLAKATQRLQARRRMEQATLREPARTSLDSRSFLAIGLGFFVAVLGLVTTYVLGVSIYPLEDAARAQVSALAVTITLAFLLFVPAVFLARRSWGKRHPSDRRGDRRATICAGIGLALTVVAIALTVVRTPSLREYVFGPDIPPEANLAMNWHRELIARVTLERDGKRIEDFEGKVKGVGGHYLPGRYTVRGFKDDVEVYQEEFDLPPGGSLGVNLFEAPMDPSYATLRVECQDPTLTIEVRGTGHHFHFSRPASGGAAVQGLKPGVKYRFGFGRGQQSIHTEDVQLASGETRTLQIPTVVFAERTVNLKPKAGSFPLDVVRMEIAPDRSVVAVGRLDGSIFLFDAETGQERFVIERPKSHCTAFGFAPDSRHLAYVVVPADRSEPVLRTFNVHDGQSVGEDVKPKDWQFSNAHALAFSPDGKRLAVSSAYNHPESNFMRSRLHRFEWPTGKPISTTKESQDGTIEMLQFTANGEDVLAISGTKDSVAWKWDADVNANHMRFHTEEFVHELVAAGRGGAFIAGWSEALGQACIRSWLSPILSELPPSDPPLSPIRFASLAVSPDGRTVLAGTKGGPPHMSWEKRAAIHMWDIKTGKERAVFLGHNDWPLDLAFSRGGDGLVSAGKDGTLRFWTLPE